METQTRKLDSEGMLGLAAALLALAMLAPATAGAQASFTPLGVLPGSSVCGLQSANLTNGKQISGDGLTVVGQCETLTGRPAFRWTAATGMVPLDSSIAHQEPTGLSYDGRIVVGNAAVPPLGGFRWELGFGTQFFPATGEYGFLGISNDGTTMVGGDGFRVLAFYWTSATGFVSLGTLPVCGGSRAIAVSGDGSVIAGTAGGGNCSPTINHHVSWRWTQATGMQQLPLDPGFPNVVVHANSVSADGSTIVGFNGGLFSSRAVRWIEENGSLVTRDLGSLSGTPQVGPDGTAWDVSADGCTIVGTRVGGAAGFVWDPVNGMRDVHNLLTSGLGLDLTGYQVTHVEAVSDDGTTIAGVVRNLSLSRNEPFVATIPNPVCAVNAAPTADAGLDQTVDEGTLVTLDGSASGDPDGDALSFSWQQIAGTAVTLSSASAAQPTFTAPYLSANETLSFQLVVGDGEDSSEPDTVDITVVNVNNPPVADAGDDATIKEGAVATLDASNSFDPDGNALSYLWTQLSGPPVVLDDPTSPTPSFTAPLGVGAQLVFELVVDDGGQEPGAPDTVTLTVVENSAPGADAGPDQTRDEGAVVTLDGSGSADPDGGDTLSYLWTQVSGPMVVLDDPTSPTPSFTAPGVGAGGEDVVFELVVTDDDPVNPRSSAADTVTVSVRNVNDPPSCDLARSVCPDSKLDEGDGCLMWPPNHKMLSVGIAGVTDPDDGGVTIEITGVTQDEPVNGQGDGDSGPDAVIQLGDPADSVLLRAERTGLGGAMENGRVYVVSFTASDGAGSCTGSVTVGVPHDRKDTPVDDGQLFDSTPP